MTRPSTLSVALGFLTLLAAALHGCQGKPADQASAPAETAPNTTASVPGKPGLSNACVGQTVTGTPQVLKIGAVEWVLNGSTLSQRGPDADGELRIGALTDIKEPSADNLGNLAKFKEWFATRKIDLLVVAGDSGEDESQLTQVYDFLAQLNVPLGALMGNREGLKAFEAALGAVGARYPHVFNLNLVRRIDTPLADLISLSGYYDPEFLHADDGCIYTTQDAARLALLAKFCDSPVVLVSHGPPRMATKDGIDAIAEGDNRGDPALSAVIAQANIPFGIFGNIHEAGGKATNRDGSKVYKPGEAADQLYLNPGPADGVRWKMNDGTISYGMAGILTIKDGKASYEIMRMPPRAQ